MTELVRIASAALSASISSHGAELSSLIDATGAEWLTAVGRGYHSPISFPVVGTLNQDRYRHDDQVHVMGRHGFARDSLFELIEHAEHSAVFRLTETEATLKAFPFLFQLDLGYRVTGSVLQITAQVTNTNTRAMPFSIGLQLGVLWPLPHDNKEGTAGHILFEHAEPQAVCLLDQAGLIIHDSYPTPVTGKCFVPDARSFAEGPILWDHLNSRKIWVVRGKARAALSFPDMPMLGVWYNQATSALRISPAMGRSDLAGYQGDFRDRNGVVMLEPGQSSQFHLDITLDADANAV